MACHFCAYLRHPRVYSLKCLLYAQCEGFQGPSQAALKQLLALQTIDMLQEK